ncbi:MAG TPA: FGGY-family carbohydrate kinase [Acidimicrobiia bacterium]|nr:FGGY-family carbohydrate kinase [Acidimicrobiia bacterium]
MHETVTVAGPVVLAVDAGSTTAKAQPFDAAGRPLAPVVRSRVTIAPDGTADAMAFLASVESAIDEALARWPGAVDAVAVSCAWHGLVGLGADGRPTTPLSTWSATGPAVVAAAEDLRRRLGDAEAAVSRRTGAPVHPSFPAARLLAERVRDPSAYAATARWCSIGELLEGCWLAAAPGPSSSMASASGLFDQESRTWDADVVEALRLRPATLAAVDDRPRRGLAAAYRRRWPALAGAVWWPALGDGACALLGTGCDRPAGDARDTAGGRRPLRAALTVGTSAAVRVLAGPAQRAARPAGLFAYLLDADRVVLGAARSNAGNLVEWLSDVLRLDGGGVDLVAEVAARAPGAHGLVAVPSLAGERSPDWPPAAAGSVSGLHPGTTAVDIAQAFLEAAVAGLADGVDRLEGGVGGDLVLVGSGRALASSPAWRQLVADGTGRPVFPSRVEEASARGAAVAALDGLGWQSPVAGDGLDGDPVLPDRTRAEAFARLRRVGRTG